MKVKVPPPPPPIYRQGCLGSRNLEKLIVGQCRIIMAKMKQTFMSTATFQTFGCVLAYGPGNAFIRKHIMRWEESAKGSLHSQSICMAGALGGCFCVNRKTVTVAEVITLTVAMNREPLLSKASLRLLLLTQDSPQTKAAESKLQLNLLSIILLKHT